jgi:hypothetical protein
MALTEQSYEVWRDPSRHQRRNKVPPVSCNHTSIRQTGALVNEKRAHLRTCWARRDSSTAEYRYGLNEIINSISIA